MEKNDENINNIELAKNLINLKEIEEISEKKPNQYISKNQKFRVDLYIYDLSNGMAKTMSPFLMGKTIEAIYHSCLVVHGIEYFFSGGIQKGHPGVSTFIYIFYILLEYSLWKTN